MLTHPGDVSGGDVKLQYLVPDCGEGDMEFADGADGLVQCLITVVERYLHRQQLLHLVEPQVLQLTQLHSEERGR